MHGTLLYPLPGRPRLAPPRGARRIMPPPPKLPSNLHRRMSVWKRTLLAELFNKTGIWNRWGR